MVSLYRFTPCTQPSRSRPLHPGPSSKPHSLTRAFDAQLCAVHLLGAVAVVAAAPVQAAEAERLRNEVLVLEARCAALQRQLSEVEAGRRLFNDLEATHSSMQRRLAAARASDEIYNTGIAPTANHQPPQYGQGPQHGGWGAMGAGSPQGGMNATLGQGGGGGGGGVEGWGAGASGPWAGGQGGGLSASFGGPGGGWGGDGGLSATLGPGGWVGAGSPQGLQGQASGGGLGGPEPPPWAGGRPVPPAAPPGMGHGAPPGRRLRGELSSPVVGGEEGAGQRAGSARREQERHLPVGGFM